ncbi:MAG: hypothetical protein JKY65_19520 [Planctomycetes bacterium]|nr:hypothetical protein [Planctomycetota bacterium]
MRFSIAGSLLLLCTLAGVVRAGDPPEAAKSGKAPAKPTYYEHVAPIVQERCQVCHRKGAVGPFSMTTYKETAGWAAMIEEVVETRRMPPWHADPKVNSFKNSRRLSDLERDTILNWVKAGAPKGDKAKAPPKKTWPDPKAWRIGTPDAIVEMPESFTVPATGVVPYQYWEVKTDFESDKWIQGIEVQIGATQVVHHVLIFVHYPNRRRSPRVRGGLQGYFASALPGDSIELFPEGSGKWLPKGSSLVFQVHYTPDGTKRVDRSKIGLKFATTKVERRVQTVALNQTRFSIPAGEPNHVVRGTYVFKEDKMLLAMLPHMHLRGKGFRYLLRRPDGSSLALLSVPRYDFNWQNAYRLKNPVFVPKGSKVIGVATFDNSDQNPANPDPTKTVRFGEQTWDEMMIGYMNVVDPTESQRAAYAKQQQTQK